MGHGAWYVGSVRVLGWFTGRRRWSRCTISGERVGVWADWYNAVSKRLKKGSSHGWAWVHGAAALELVYHLRCVLVRGRSSATLWARAI